MARLDKRITWKRWDVNANHMSTENLNHLNKIVPRNSEPRDPYTRSITFSKYRHRRQSVPQNSISDIIRQQQPKGIIFVWPQRKNFIYEQQYAVFIRVLTHVLYWLGIMGLFPSGAAMAFKRPPWKVEAPLPKPENRDYIIEPDWNSVFKTD